MSKFLTVPVSQIIVPLNGLLRQFEKGKQDFDIDGNPIQGQGDTSYMKYYERRLSMENELRISGYANHTPIHVYQAKPNTQIETTEGVIQADNKYIVCDGVQRTGTAYEFGHETPVQIQIETEERAREIMISANYQRKENKPSQFTKILKLDLAENPQLTVTQLAGKYSMAPTSINRYLTLTTLPAEIIKTLGEKEGVTVGTGVKLAESIKKLGVNAEIKNSLVLAAKSGNLDEVAKEIEEENKKKRRAALKLTPVYVEKEPIYNAERARIVIAELENVLQDDPENEILRAKLDVWQFIHGVTPEDKRKHRENWEKKNK